MSRHRRSPVLAPVLLSTASCLALLLAGYALKRCSGPLGDGRTTLLCYSDITTFFAHRGIAQMPFPYLSGSISGTALRDGALEYPVLTGLVAWLPAQVLGSAAGYLAASALLLTLPAVLVAVLLARWVGRRALLWAAAPGLVLFAFHNWDVLAVCATVLGLDAWRRGGRASAGAWFALGAAAKLYPALFLAPLVLSCLTDRDRRGALRVAAGALAVTAAVDLPFLVVNPGGWWATYAFHSRRPPNIDSIWGQFAEHWSIGAVNRASALLALAGTVAVLAAGQRRAARERSYPFLQVAAALLAVFMASNKVSSPQYTLWLLPFLALLPVGVGWWLAYAVNDLVLYWAVFYAGPISLGLAQPWLEVGVAVREGLLLCLVVVFLRAGAPRAEEVTWSPSPRAHAPVTSAAA